MFFSHLEILSASLQHISLTQVWPKLYFRMSLVIRDVIKEQKINCDC